MKFIKQVEPLVSVIMNCRNGEKYLRQAIDSVLSQSYKNWEIVFWDNQSNDNSAEIFNSYADPRLRYFLAPCYTALGEARNLAIQRASGEFIAFLDCDDLWLPRKLEKQIPLFQRESVGLVICDTIFFNEKKNIRQLYKAEKPPSGLVFGELLGRYFVSLETAVIRASALSNMSRWFDATFEVIEEYDFFVRLGYLWEVAYVDEVLAKWRVHASSWTWTRPELFPAESRVFLEKLTSDIPDCLINYKSEIESVRIKIALQEAIIAWREGNLSRAHNLLVPYLAKSNQVLLIFLWLKILPFKSFDFINKLRVGLLS